MLEIATVNMEYVTWWLKTIQHEKYYYRDPADKLYGQAGLQPGHPCIGRKTHRPLAWCYAGYRSDEFTACF